MRNIDETMPETDISDGHVRAKLEEIARLTLEIGSTAVDVASLVADCGENLPYVSFALNTLKAIHAKIETVRSNKKELSFLAWRCDLLMGTFMVKRQGGSSGNELERHMKECFKEVHQLVDRCSERRWCCSFLRATRDKDTINSLRERIRDLADDLGLVNIYNMIDKLDDFKGKLVRFLLCVLEPSARQGQFAHKSKRGQAYRLLFGFVAVSMSMVDTKSFSRNHDSVLLSFA